MEKINISNLSIDENLVKFINDEAIPGTNVDVKKFWDSFSEVVNKLAPKNKSLIQKRAEIQKKIDEWHISKKESIFDKKEYINFLKSIGYIVEEKSDFKISTSNVDQEISSIPGPQLVVPVDNARYALNAANARWGSFYDALYGTDVIPGKTNKGYDDERAKKVINYSREFLDNIFSITDASWKDITKIKLEEKNLALFINEKKFYLKNKNQFVGFNGEAENLNSILLKNNNLHIDILIDPKSAVGKNDKAGISDIIIESAISTIVDNEDSVAAVDSKDKVKCYRNWLGLMKGDLKTEVQKNNKKFTRKLNPDRVYKSPDGSKITLHGRALLLNRNVGHLMTNPAIVLKDGSEIPEGIMDAFFSTLCALHDFKNKKNSRTNSVYIVKPKMHGPEEVDFTNEIFENVEKVLNLKKIQLKLELWMKKEELRLI